MAPNTPDLASESRTDASRAPTYSTFHERVRYAALQVLAEGPRAGRDLLAELVRKRVCLNNYPAFANVMMHVELDGEVRSMVGEDEAGKKRGFYETRPKAAESRNF
jgi:hypothetical protein